MTSKALLHSWGMNHMVRTDRLPADIPLLEMDELDTPNDDIDDEVRMYLNDVDDPRWYDGVVKRA